MSTERRKSDGQPLAPEGRDKEVVSIEAAFSGPLPLPGLLAKYNEIIPSGAERIMAMAERQSAHREQLEKEALRANIARETRGAYFAFTLALVAILVGGFLAYAGKGVAGLSTIIASVGTLAGTFIYSKHEQRKEREAKSQALQSRRNPR